MSLPQIKALVAVMDGHGYPLASKTYAGCSYRPIFYREHRFYAMHSPGFLEDYRQEFFYGNGLTVPLAGRRPLDELYRANEAESLELDHEVVDEYANMLLWFLDGSPRIRQVMGWVSESWRNRIPANVARCMEKVARCPRLVRTLTGGRFLVEYHFLDANVMELRRNHILLSRDGRILEGPLDAGLLVSGTHLAV